MDGVYEVCHQLPDCNDNCTIFFPNYISILYEKFNTLLKGVIRTPI